MENTLYKMLNSQDPDWQKFFPEPRSYFFDGASARLKSLPKEVVVWHSAGDFSHIPGRMHHRYNLIINLKELCQIGSDGRQYTLNENQVILIFPTQCHHFVKTPKIEAHHRLHFTFVLTDPSDHSLEPLRNRIVTLNRRTKKILSEIVLMITSAKCCHSPEIPLLTAQLLNIFLVSDDILCNTFESTNTFFLKAMDYIRGNYTKHISIKMVADALSISPSRLADIFKEQTNGVTIGLFIDRLRLFHAVEFLGTTDMTIAQIAMACGYGNQFSFSRRFKQLIGFAPNSYRKRCMERNLIGPGKYR